MSQFQPPQGQTPAPTSVQYPSGTWPAGQQQSAVVLGRLVVHVSALIPISLFGSPRLLIDGYQVGARYGVNVVDVAAGWHRVQLYSQYLWRYGHAWIDVQVPPHGEVNVFYAEPVTYWMGQGNIGLVPQKSGGGTAFLVLLVAVFALVPLMFGFLLLLARV